MHTTTGINIAFGSIPLAGFATRGVLAGTVLTICALICFLAHEIRVACRERRDNRTARYMFDRCDDTTAAFGVYAEVLKTREGPPT